MQLCTLQSNTVVQASPTLPAEHALPAHTVLWQLDPVAHGVPSAPVTHTL
jgi:hypothetical protein